MKNRHGYLLLTIFITAMFAFASCKTKDVNKYSRTQYVNQQYKELKDLLPEAQVILVNDTIKVLFPNNLLFGTAEYTISESVNPLIERLAVCLNKYSKTTIMVCGHADNVGQTNSNQELSQKRADAAKNLLISNQVDSTRVHSWGFGDRQPLVSNDTEENKSLNRRVEFIILIDESAYFKK